MFFISCFISFCLNRFKLHGVRALERATHRVEVGGYVQRCPAGARAAGGNVQPECPSKDAQPRPRVSGPFQELYSPMNQ